MWEIVFLEVGPLHWNILCSSMSGKSRVCELDHSGSQPLIYYADTLRFGISSSIIYYWTTESTIEHTSDSVHKMCSHLSHYIYMHLQIAYSNLCVNYGSCSCMGYCDDWDITINQKLITIYIKSVFVWCQLCQIADYCNASPQRWVNAPSHLYYIHPWKSLNMHIYIVCCCA